jgi:hypothetical protein
LIDALQPPEIVHFLRHRENHNADQRDREGRGRGRAPL